MSEQKKVIVPVDVAQAIDAMHKDYGYSLYSFMSCIHDIHRRRAEEVRMQEYIDTLCSFASEQYETLMSALINGYEVEQTPEDKLRYYIQHHRDKSTEPRRLPESRAFHDGLVRGCVDTLNIIGIKIEGINA